MFSAPLNHPNGPHLLSHSDPPRRPGAFSEKGQLLYHVRPGQDPGEPCLRIFASLRARGARNSSAGMQEPGAGEGAAVVERRHGPTRKETLRDRRDSGERRGTGPQWAGAGGHYQIERHLMECGKGRFEEARQVTLRVEKGPSGWTARPVGDQRLRVRLENTLMELGNKHEPRGCKRPSRGALKLRR